MSDDDFDWHESESIVLREQPRTACYINPEGDIVLRQANAYGDDDDAFVYIRPENVPRVVQALLAAAGYETDQTYGKPLMLPKLEPLSGAERQKRYRDRHRNGIGDERSDELPLRPVTNGHSMELAS